MLGMPIEKRVIILVGAMGVGKDTTLVKLIDRYGIGKVVSYTTRPARISEINFSDYHFITTDEFITKIKNNEFLEYNTYKLPGNPIWYYGIGNREFDAMVTSGKPFGIVVELNGLKEVLNKYSGNCTVVLLNIDEETSKQRVNKRKEYTPKQYRSRYNIDLLKNQELTELADIIIDTSNISSDEVAKKIGMTIGLE